MYIYIHQIKLFFKLEFFAKVIWVMSNFLTMEFYRKLCNRFYWKKLTPNTISYRTRFWMIVFSAITALLLAFYYDPSDPACSFSSGYIVLLASIALSYSSTILISFLRFVSKYTAQSVSSISFGTLESKNIFLWRSQGAYLRTASLLI
jgi:hypothetical protein